MIVRKKDAPSQLDESGWFSALRYSDAGGLTQYGAYVVELPPGARSSERHWHEKEDEFLYVLSGEAIVVENDGEHVLGPGDSACWPAGVPNGHCVLNRTSAPCTFLIMGTRPAYDACHYPDAGKTCYTEGETWRLVRDDGTVLKSGRIP